MHCITRNRFAESWSLITSCNSTMFGWCSILKAYISRYKVKDFAASKFSIHFFITFIATSRPPYTSSIAIYTREVEPLPSSFATLYWFISLTEPWCEIDFKVDVSLTLAEVGFQTRHLGALLLRWQLSFNS